MILLRKIYNEQVELHNYTVREGRISYEWRASIIPVFEKEDKSNPENYRDTSIFKTILLEIIAVYLRKTGNI